jgi:MSHA pilin protein MshC
MLCAGGFTLIELALIIALAGILMVAAYGSVDLSGTRIVAVAQVMKSHLQYAQDMAMTQGSSFGFEGVSSDTYRIFEGSPGTPARDPLTNGNFDVSISPVAFAGTVPTITFLSSGHPDVTSDVVITLSEGVKTVQLTVRRSTGYVTISP